MVFKKFKLENSNLKYTHDNNGFLRVVVYIYIDIRYNPNVDGEMKRYGYRHDEDYPLLIDLKTMV